jgi:filamentous hemagglutinin family protein
MKNKSIASLSLRKLLLSVLVTAPLATLPVPLWALPASQTALNGIVTPSSGVTVTWTNANRLDVSSTATNSVVKWTDFGAGSNTIGASDLINYQLPSSSASVLNMVTGTNPSTINGALTANGNLYVLNPNGITVGGTGVITGNSVGLSTVNEPEYNFLVSGTLSYIPQTTTTGAISVSPGAVITAASGTGNVWITSAGANLAGTIDGGNVSVTTQNNGSVILGNGGGLTVGDTVAKSANLTVTTVGTGAITVGDALVNSAVTIYGGTASLTTANQAILQAGTGALTLGAGGSANSTLTANAGTGAITLGNLANNNGNTLTATVTGAAVSVTAPTGKLAVGGTATGGLTVATGAGNLTINAGNVTGVLAATATGGDILSGGNMTASGNINLTVPTGGNVTFAGKTTGGAINVTGAGATPAGNVILNSTGDLALTALSAANLTASAAGNITQTGTQNLGTGNVTLTTTGSNGNITLSQGITADKLTATASKLINVSTAQTIATSATLTSGTTLTLGAALKGTALTTLTGNATTDLTISAAQNATTANLTAGGNIAINAALTAPTLNATASKITQTAGITSTGTATLTGSASITLTNVGNDFTTVVVKSAPSGASITDANGLTLGNATNVTGNLTITGSKATAGDIVFGAASADAITVAGNLVVDNTGTANANITDLSDNITANGNATLSVAGATGAVTLDGSTGNAIGLNHQFGVVNITTAGGNAKLFEKTTANLGNVSLSGGNLNVYSATGIIDSGRLQANNINVGAGTASAPGDIALNYTSTTTPNAITGTVTVQNDLGLLGLGTIGNYLAKSLTVTAGTVGAGSLVDIPVNVYGSGLTGPISITTTGAANLIAGSLKTTGAVSLTSDTGSITASNAGNTFTSLTLTSNNTTGASAVSTTGDLTVNGTLTGTQAVGYTAAGNLTIGSYTSGTTGATTFTAGATKALADSVTGISIYSDVTFSSGSISITKSGHNFGGVTLLTSGDGNATIVESGTLRLAGVTLGNGALSATSQSGNIIQSALITSAGNTTLSTPAGAITLNTTTNNVTGTLSVTQALGNVSYKTSGALSIGNVTTSGTFAADTSSGASKAISQAGNSTINAYGATSFITAGGDITVANSGNRFGGLTLTAAAGNVTLKELTTVNLKSVSTSGVLAVTSEAGNIQDSGTVLSTGSATFTASNGAITLGNASSNYVSVGLTSAGNASIIDGVGSLGLAASTVGGALTVSNTAANGNISQSGVLGITGDATFSATTASASTSSIILNNSANRFGAVQFTAGTGGVIIDEATTFNLKGGSVTYGQATLTTGGDFVTSGGTTSRFLSTTAQGLTINAINGAITPGANSILVLNGLTVISNVSKNLSALSLSGDLNGVSPTNQGTGTYTGPGL